MKLKIAILGAGISGLSAAWYLQKRYGDEIDITIFEANDRVGGWIYTRHVDGALFECGPRSLRATTKELLVLIEELGLLEQILPASPDAKKRYILYRGALEPLPHDLFSLVGSKLGRKILSACVREPFKGRSAFEDESVKAFFERRIGKNATKTFVSALCAGIYAAEPAELSMRSSFPSFWEKERAHGSLIKATLFAKQKEKMRSFTFRDGLSILPKTLASKLQAKVKLNAKVSQIEEDREKVVLVADGVYHFDHLISTIAPIQLAALLPANDPLKAPLSIPQTSLVTASVAFKERLDLPAGFGFLCPSHEDPILLGVVFDSLLFPEQNGPYQTRLSIMMGGSKASDLILYSDEALFTFTRQFAQKYLQISSCPDMQFVIRAKNAISRYPVGHHRTLELLAEQKRKVHLFGSGLHGVSVGEGIASAAKVINIF